MKKLKNGWVQGSAQEFLELSDADMAYIETKRLGRVPARPADETAPHANGTRRPVGNQSVPRRQDGVRRFDCLD